MFVPDRAAVVAVAWLVTGCGPDASDLRAWAGRSDGQERLVAVVAGGGHPEALRQEAAWVLCDSGHPHAVADALGGIGDGVRGRIVGGVAARLIAAIEGDAREGAVRAKDALYLLAPHLSDGDRARAAEAVSAWFLADLRGRSASGRATAGQVLPALGPAAAAGLVALVAKGESVPEVLDVLGKFDDQGVRDSAARALLGPARAGGPEDLLLVTRLTSPVLVPFMVEKLADAGVPDDVKNEYFDHVVRCGGPEAGPGLARLLGDHDLRWVAADSLVRLEGVAGVARVLASLPATDRRYDEQLLYDETRFFCTRPVRALAADAAKAAALEKVLLDGLAPTRLVSALTAVQCLGLYGSAAAAGPLRALAGDRTRVPGWAGRGATLGRIAAAAVDDIEKRAGKR